MNKIVLHHRAATDILLQMRGFIGQQTFDDGLFSLLFLYNLPQQALIFSFQSSVIETDGIQPIFSKQDGDLPLIILQIFTMIQWHTQATGRPVSYSLNTRINKQIVWSLILTYFTHFIKHPIVFRIKICIRLKSKLAYSHNSHHSKMETVEMSMGEKK